MPVTMRDVAEGGRRLGRDRLARGERQAGRPHRRGRARARATGDRASSATGPNASAKNLVSGASKFIGLVADAIATTPFAGQIIHGAQDEAWKHGYVLLVANTEGNETAENEAIAMMLEHKVRGILYSTWYHRAAEIPAALLETDSCSSTASREDSRLPAVVPDEVQGGRTATDLLVAAGHRRIAFINTTTPSPAQTADCRVSGSARGRRHRVRRSSCSSAPRPGRRLRRRRAMLDPA